MKITVMIFWRKRPGNQSAMIEHGPLRTYLPTEQNELFVCGERVGDESRAFTFYGELGLLEEPMYENCTSRLYIGLQFRKVDFWEITSLREYLDSLEKGKEYQDKAENYFYENERRPYAGRPVKTGVQRPDCDRYVFAK